MFLDQSTTREHLVSLILKPEKSVFENSKKYKSDWGKSDTSDIDEVLYG
jgi:hypothetical protein